MAAISTTINIQGIVVLQNGGGVSYSPPQIVNTTQCGQSYQIAIGTVPVEITLPTNTIFFSVIPQESNTIPISFGWSSSYMEPISPLLGIPCLGVSTQLTFWLSSTSSTIVNIISG